MTEHLPRVIITNRTADGLLTRCKELEHLAARFRAVGSRGRAQQLTDIAATLRKMGNDLKQELQQKDKRKLPQIAPPSHNGAF